MSDSTGKGTEMRHFGKLAGAALIALVPTVVSAQMGAPAGVPMQPGGWSQGGWQPGGTAAPTYEPGAQGYAAQDYRGHAMDRHGDYRRLSRGKRLPEAYRDPRYTVSDWNDWGFAPPGPGMRWVRYYDDGILVDTQDRIVDERPGVDWNRGYRHGPHGYGEHGYDEHGYGMRGGYPGGAGYGYPLSGGSTYHAGPNTTVTTRVVPTPPPMIVGAPGYGYGGGGYYGGGAQVVAVTPGVAVTTTTTTTDYETVYRSVAVRRRVWRRPVHHYYHPRCAHATSCPVLGS